MQNLLWSAATIKARGEPIDRHAGTIHPVTGPEALTFAGVADTLSRVLGRPVRYVDLTDDQLKAGLLASGQSDWQATALVGLSTYARHGHASVVTDTIPRIAGRPARTLERWAQDQAAAFRP
jgi:uncharacterized protein YbjT (DUF2867 family)